MDVELAGIRLHLLSGRGVFWPAANALLVADLHLGKEATFRQHGIAVPRGSTEGTLTAVTRMLEETSAEQLIVLGDLFHARSSLRKDVCDSMDVFLDRHEAIHVRLISGNHDKNVGSLAKRWQRIKDVGGELLIDGLHLSHFPGEPAGKSQIRIAGHLHPAVRLGRHAHVPGKLACFWWSAGCLVLPAVGEFTGTASIRPKPADRVWVIAEDKIVPLRPPARL